MMATGAVTVAVTVLTVLAAHFQPGQGQQHSGYAFLPPTSSVHISNGFAHHSSSVLHQRHGHSLGGGGGYDHQLDDGQAEQRLDEVAHRQNFVQNILPYAEPLIAPVRPPPQFSPPAGGTCGQAPGICTKSRYRSFDGSCNNLPNPSLGIANSRYSRLLSAKYGDGVSAPTVSVTGAPLPSSRLISLVVFGEADVPDPQFTLANMQWGQIMTHDMSMLAGSTQSKRHGTRCCTDDGKLIHDNAPTKCYPIIVPDNDPAYAQAHIDCMNFVRSQTDADLNCPPAAQPAPAAHGHGLGGLGQPAVEQITTVTAFMDLSLVYGNSDQQNGGLRARQGGRMRVEERNGYEWPPQAPNASAVCDVESAEEVCYLAGDSRVNQNPGLAILQIVLLREHNRIADVLQHLNPHWEDELTFQEARRINVAQYQHISYYEWLPIFLGTENMLKNRLIYQTTKGSYVNDYDANIDPSVINSHATAAFRYFHSQIEGRLDLISEIRTSLGTLRLSDWFNRPAIIEVGDNYDGLGRGLATQPEQLTDINFDPEIKHFLFRRQRPFGSDLRAIDIQRNRDHGLAGYNDFREYCGLRRAHSWEDFLDLISPKNLERLQSVYASHEDVDVAVGGALEAHVEGTLAGPVFLCILTEQFYRTRVGDRYFYENGEKEAKFTRNQLNEIRKASMARLFCDDGNHIHSVQPKAFLRISKKNPLLPCSDIPVVDLSAWKDISGGGSAAPEHNFGVPDILLHGGH